MASEMEDFLASEYGQSRDPFWPNDENKCCECTLRKLAFLRTEKIKSSLMHYCKLCSTSSKEI
jgi:hypothetical protein